MPALLDSCWCGCFPLLVAQGAPLLLILIRVLPASTPMSDERGVSPIPTTPTGAIGIGSTSVPSAAVATTSGLATAAAEPLLPPPLPVAAG